MRRFSSRLWAAGFLKNPQLFIRQPRLITTGKYATGQSCCRRFILVNNQKMCSPFSLLLLASSLYPDNSKNVAHRWFCSETEAKTVFVCAEHKGTDLYTFSSNWRSSSSVKQQLYRAESVRSDGLSSKFRCPHRRTRFCWVLEVRVKRSHSPFEDKTTWRLWGISFAQMSSLIQRWMVAFEGQRSRSLWSYVQSLGLPQSFLFFLLLLE